MNALPQKENLKKFADIDACPVRHILSRITGKWSVLILCILAENEITRFSEIGRALPDISPKVLSSTLKNLEADGLIYRNLYAEIPPRVEYSLTPLGRRISIRLSPGPLPTSPPSSGIAGPQPDRRNVNTPSSTFFLAD